MALCEKLEQQQHQRHSFQSALRQSALQAVSEAASPHELQLTWTRLRENFDSLIQVQEDVNALRDTILYLAMRGVLLPTAAIGVSSSEEDLPAVALGWSWKTLGKLSEHITSGSRGWREFISRSGDIFIRSQDIKHDALVFENPAFVTLPEKAEGQRTLVREGDLLLTITGGNVGKCAVVPRLPGKAYVSQHVALIRLHDSSLAEFIHFWIINTFGGRKFLSRYIYGDKPGLNLNQVASIPIPFLPETVRAQVFATLSKLNVMCKQLAKQVDGERHLAELFAATAVTSITGSTVDQQENKAVKAPQTELIAVVRLGQTPSAKAQAPLATILAHHSGELAANDLWQRFGSGIDDFYAQLKSEVARGWIQEPGIAEMREIPREQETA
jgi:type I restriction enzyme S subunit